MLPFSSVVGVIFGFLGAVLWLLVALAGSPAGFGQPVDFMPSLCFLFLAGSASAVALTRRPSVLRSILFLASMAGALGFVEVGVCVVDFLGWRSAVGIVCGIFVGLPMLAVAWAARARLRAVRPEATGA